MNSSIAAERIHADDSLSVFSLTFPQRRKQERRCQQMRKVVRAPETDLRSASGWKKENRITTSFPHGETLIEPSAMGLKRASESLTTVLRWEPWKPAGDETWSPVVGEQAEIRDYYEQASIVLEHITGIDITVELRAYDTGVAFRYLAPDVPKDGTRTRLRTRPPSLCFPRAPRQTSIPAGTRPSRCRLRLKTLVPAQPTTAHDHPVPQRAAMTICRQTWTTTA